MSFILKNSLQMSLKGYSKRQCNWESGSTIPELKASVPFFSPLSLYKDISVSLGAFSSNLEYISGKLLSKHRPKWHMLYWLGALSSWCSNTVGRSKQCASMRSSKQRKSRGILNLSPQINNSSGRCPEMSFWLALSYFSLEPHSRIHAQWLHFSIIWKL